MDNVLHVLLQFIHVCSLNFADITPTNEESTQSSTVSTESMGISKLYGINLLSERWSHLEKLFRRYLLYFIAPFLSIYLLVKISCLHLQNKALSYRWVISYTERWWTSNGNRPEWLTKSRCKQACSTAQTTPVTSR